MRKAGAEYSRYVQYLPAMSAEDVARIGYRKFMRGRKVIVTGWFNRLGVVAARFTPNLVLLPFMGFLFRVRDAEGNLRKCRLCFPPSKPAAKRTVPPRSPAAAPPDAARTRPPQRDRAAATVGDLTPRCTCACTSKRYSEH